jgi:serine/threonine protein kinase
VPAAVGAVPERIGRYQLRSLLASGSTASVYLGYDEELQRNVAIKVIHPQLLASGQAGDMFLREARNLARLDHPGIVAVHDAGRAEGGFFYIVFKFIEGSDLKRRLAESRLSWDESASLVAAVAEALHHAHQVGIIHRDIKPANIMLDREGRPVVADFGVALTREAFGTGPAFVGTPNYMSPEQARRESHRVDARTDIYGLGAVLYELLTGRTPFHAPTRDELLEQIKHCPPTPPRQLDASTPEELERICLKALSKRASDRHATARELADDLKAWQASATPTQISTPTPAPPKPGESYLSRLDSSTLRVVPRGLRSFSVEDAEYFLALLPGPRDRHGLPESVAFWKRRIESTECDLAFRVGVLYGPSGSGKSSLVRAGLLPRLDTHVRTLMIEADAHDTETRLREQLRKQLPSLEADRLPEAFIALRQGAMLPAQQKLFIVIDQFEQWLHTTRGTSDTELVDALRQCDGVHVQCLLLVRDDFWLPVGRFMRDLEIPLVDGVNAAAADRFDPLHARAVLAEFGRAYRRLPARKTPLTAEQEHFLDQALEGLTEDGAIAPVRLSLFAEMVKGKVWRPETLREVGGARGVGLAFLEDRLGERTAPAPYRPYTRAARAVLAALVPEMDNDLRGAAQPEVELRERAGYADQPGEFDALLRILDGELRLLTPAVESDGSVGRRYQLTHDYLVPSLREWLSREQRSTRRGRAELCLAERTTAWESRREARNLPSLGEWFAIRFLTRSSQWTIGQEAMMRQATRHHVTRLLVLGFLAIFLGFGGWEAWARHAERVRRNRLLRPELTPEAREYLRGLDFTDLVTNIPGIFYLKDRNGVYIYANDSWIYDPERDDMRLVHGMEMVGKTDAELPWKHDANFIRAQDQKVMKSGEAETFHEMHRMKDGSQAPFVTLKAPLRNSDGHIIGIIGYTIAQPPRE